MHQILRGSLIAGILAGIVLGPQPIQAQYAADYQANIISGVTSNWSGDYLVGSNTFADVLLILGGGVLTDGYGYLGYEVSSSNNDVLVIGPGSVWSNSADLSIGYYGAGNQLTIADGGQVVNSVGNMGYGADSSSNNSVLVTGAGSVWNSSWATIGYYGAGNRLAITDGGQVVAGTSYVAYQASSSSNSILVAGTGSVWNSGDNLYLGFFGADNSLVISNGGQVLTGPICVVGRFGGSSNNSVLVTDPGSLWSCDGWELMVGGSGWGSSLVVSNGGSVVNGGYGYVGHFSSGCSALVTGSGSVWSNLYDLILGEDGAGNNLVISDGGQVVNADAYLGMGSDNNSSNGVLVAGTGSVWSVSGNLNVGWSGPWSSVVISNGGVVIDQSGYIGDYSISNSALVTGSGSIWSNNSDLYVGSEGAANQLTIAAGGQVASGSATVGDDGNSSGNSVLITDPGSVWSIGSLYVGNSGAGNSMIISNDGGVFGGYSIIGSELSSSNNCVSVVGAGSVWDSHWWLGVGDLGSGNRLEVSHGGEVTTTGLGIGDSLIEDNQSHDNVLVVSDGGSVVCSADGGDAMGSLDFEGQGNSMIISNGGRVFDNYSVVSDNAASSEHRVVVTGSGSVWSTANWLYIGEGGFGSSLVVSNGGQVICGEGHIGWSESRSNSVLVTGAGSVWSNNGALYVSGSDGVGNSLVISDGGQVVNDVGSVDGSSNSVQVVDGGLWCNGVLYAGGSSNLLEVAGGSVLATNLVIDSGDCSDLLELDSGSVIVTNATHDAVLEVRDGVFILNGGVLQVDKLVMTNACGLFVRNGGTLIVGSVVLDPNLSAVGDGIPNGWKQQYGLDPLDPNVANEDPDGDGMSNLQEYLAGSNPVADIKTITREGNDIRVTWWAAAGKTNALQRSVGDNGGSYSNNFADIFVVSNMGDGPTNYLDTGAVTNFPAAYYRVRLVP